jgi:hypothetical protein
LFVCLFFVKSILSARINWNMLNFSISNSKHVCCLLTSISTIRVYLFSLKTKIQSYIHFLVLKISSFRYQKTKTSLNTNKYRHFCFVFSLYLFFSRKFVVYGQYICFYHQFTKRALLLDTNCTWIIWSCSIIAAAVLCCSIITIWRLMLRRSHFMDTGKYNYTFLVSLNESIERLVLELIVSDSLTNWIKIDAQRRFTNCHFE